MTGWSNPIHKEEKTKSGYHIKVYVSDPYYHVEVYKDGELIGEHLLSNDEAELDALVKKYERCKGQTCEKNTREELLLILSYARAVRLINSQCYRSVRSANTLDIERFLDNIGLIKNKG